MVTWGVVLGFKVLLEAAWVVGRWVVVADDKRMLWMATSSNRRAVIFWNMV